MTTELQPQTTPEVGGMGHSVKRKEDPRFIQGRGEYIEDVNLPGQLWLDIVRSPVRPRADQVDRRDRGAEDPGRRRGRDRQGPRGLQAPLDADPRRRHADGAPRGHRHVPVAGGRGRHRDVPLRGGRRRRGGRGRLRAAAGRHRPVQGARARRAGPAPGPRRGQADQPHLALGVGRRRGHRRRARERARSGSPRTSTSRASTSPRSRPAAASRTGTRSASSSPCTSRARRRTRSGP